MENLIEPIPVGNDQRLCGLHWLKTYQYGSGDNQKNGGITMESGFYDLESFGLYYKNKYKRIHLRI